MLLLAALAGCGGGLSIGIGLGGDAYPQVSLASGVLNALPGQVVRLAAAASDDDYVVEVQFFRVEPDGRSTFLGSDTAMPYELNALVPAAALPGSVVRFFARAFDSAGQATDSDPVDVGVS